MAGALGNLHLDGVLSETVSDSCGLWAHGMWQNVDQRCLLASGLSQVGHCAFGSTYCVASNTPPALPVSAKPRRHHPWKGWSGLWTSGRLDFNDNYLLAPLPLKIINMWKITSGEIMIMLECLPLGGPAGFDKSLISLLFCANLQFSPWATSGLDTILCLRDQTDFPLSLGSQNTPKSWPDKYI